MQTHFSRGLIAGLQASDSRTHQEVTRYCADYRRGFVLGYSHRCAEKSGDRNQAAFDAGVLSKRYGLDRELVAESFSEAESGYAQRYFYAGYDRAIR